MPRRGDKKAATGRSSRATLLLDDGLIFTQETYDNFIRKPTSSQTTTTTSTTTSSTTSLSDVNMTDIQTKLFLIGLHCIEARCLEALLRLRIFLKKLYILSDERVVAHVTNEDHGGSSNREEKLRTCDQPIQYRPIDVTALGQVDNGNISGNSSGRGDPFSLVMPTYPDVSGDLSKGSQLIRMAVVDYNRLGWLVEEGAALEELNANSGARGGAKKRGRPSEKDRDRDSSYTPTLRKGAATTIPSSSIDDDHPYPTHPPAKLRKSNRTPKRSRKKQSEDGASSSGEEGHDSDWDGDF